MSNQDKLHIWWWGDNGPAKEGPLTIEQINTDLQPALASGVVSGRNGRISQAGWNYAVLKFLIEKCTLPVQEKNELIANANPQNGNYRVWRRLLNVQASVNPLNSQKSNAILPSNPPPVPNVGINITKEQIDCSLQRVEDGLIKYVALQNDFKKVDVSTDRNYKRRFNYFYRIRRNAAWQSHFYKLLQENKDKGISFKNALKEIKKNTGRLEASFASKLVATINPEKPVIDKFVLENAGLQLPNPAAINREQKIYSVYEELQKKLEDFLETDNGKYLVKRFKEKFPKAQITAIKMVDLVLWQTR